MAGPGALNGYGQERDRQASAEAGLSAHLVKPVDAEELHRVLRSLETAAGYDS